MPGKEKKPKIFIHMQNIKLYNELVLNIKRIHFLLCNLSDCVRQICKIIQKNPPSVVVLINIL